MSDVNHSDDENNEMTRVQLTINTDLTRRIDRYCRHNGGITRNNAIMVLVTSSLDKYFDTDCKEME